MSRCFPFPPPGYEKKAKTDEGDNLPKEKQKEKKHKKDKDKDKEKKEKKDKERSKDKRKEKNDRKEKHKDKKKDKDRDKDKSKTSDEKRNEGRHKGYNGEKIEQNSLRAEEIKGFKFMQELGRRIRDAEKGSGGIQMLENFTGTAQRKAEGMARLVENVVDNRSEVTEKNKVGMDNKRAEVGMARLVDKDVSNRAEGKEKSTDCIDQRRDEGMARVVENAVNWAEGKEKNKEKNNDDRKADVQRNRQEERSVGNAKFHNFTSMDQQRVEGMGKPMDKDAEKRLEGKEKKKDKEGSDKHKERGPEKKSKAKDKDRSKEKKEKAEEKSDNKNREQYELKDSIKDPANTISIKTSTSKFSKESDKSCDADGNLGKRKDREVNGFLHGSNIRPNKLPRPGSSSHLLTENGKRVEPCLPSMQSTFDKQGISNKAENKECKVNGMIEAQLASVCPTKELPTAQANENGEASTKTPHPDMKYLNQILSVPKMEEWSEFDDQEWLFSSDSLQSKKPKVVGSSVVDEIPQVWAEALRMESADVCALPYVIPY